METPSGIVLLPEEPATPLSYSSEFIMGRNNFQEKIYLRIVQPPAGQLLYSVTSEIRPDHLPRYAPMGFSREEITTQEIDAFLVRLVQWRFHEVVEPKVARDLNFSLCRKLENRLITPQPEFRG